MMICSMCGEDNAYRSIASKENIDFLFHYVIESLGLNERNIAKEPLRAKVKDSGLTF